MEYVNEKFKEILRINGNLSPPSTIEDGSELLKVILKLEIFEEQAQYNDSMEESEEVDNSISPVSLNASSINMNS